MTYNEGLYILGMAIADVQIIISLLQISDSRLEAKNGFGLHTTQVDLRHKTEAFKASGAIREKSLSSEADLYSGSSQPSLSTKSPLA